MTPEQISEALRRAGVPITVRVIVSSHMDVSSAAKLWRNAVEAERQYEDSMEGKRITDKGASDGAYLVESTRLWDAIDAAESLVFTAIDRIPILPQEPATPVDSPSRRAVPQSY